MPTKPEAWLRGPIAGVPSLLQPAVHAITQCREDIHQLMTDFPDVFLWERPAAMASPAFHLQHIAGVLARMATYANGETLSDLQFDYLKKEGLKNDALTTKILLENLDHQIADFLAIVSQIDSETLTEFRAVGRAQLPSTVGGLVFHAAEHSQRHFGQLLVTVKVILSQSTV